MIRAWSQVGTGIAIGALGVAMVSGVSYAAPADIPDDSGDIKLCFNKADAKDQNGGAVLSIYDPEHNKKKCAKGDRKLEIESEGEQGPVGPVGPAGPPGANGTNGTNGEDGEDGDPGPSQIPQSGFAATNLGLGAEDVGRVFFPLGVVRNQDNGTYATAPFAFTIDRFRVVLTEDFEVPTAYTIVVSTDGGATVTGSLQCFVLPDDNADPDSCESEGSVAVPEGAVYAFATGAESDPEGEPGDLETDDAPLPAGSRFSYVINQPV